MSEVIIYSYLDNIKSGTFQISGIVAKTRPKSRLPSALLTLSKISAFIGMALILIFYAPVILAENLKMSGTEVRNVEMNVNTAKEAYKPPLDPTLSTSDRIIIPSIGVSTDIWEADLGNYEDALKKGVWRVSNFGSPVSVSEPIILAAHRFGYLAWTDYFRRANSFYNLPKLKAGDTVEIDWGQRKYVYQVYSTDENTQITDYSADLILYTCENLSGPERFFVYARLVTL